MTAPRTTGEPEIEGAAGLGSAAPPQSRVPSVGTERGTRRLPALDGLRGVAALMVLATHVGFQTGAGLHGPLAGVLSRLEIGVAIFFLLSGFLLWTPFTLAHQRGLERPRTGPYLWRRGLRILPAYWLALVGAGVLVQDLSGVDGWEWARQALLLQTFTSGHLLAGLTQTWSLATEVSFYLLLPLLALAVRRLPLPAATPLRRELALLIVLAIVGVVWTALAHSRLSPDRDVATLWLPGYLDWFALGMLGAVVRTHLERGTTGGWRAAVDLARAPGSCLLAAGLLFWLATTPLTGPRGLVALSVWEGTTRHVLYGLTSALLLLPVVLGPADGPLSRLMSTRAMHWLGETSYGLFLWHLALLTVVLRSLDIVPFTGHAWEVAAVLLPVSLTAAALSLYLVERPALRLRSIIR